MFYYINNFFLFSILGYFFETIMFALLSMHNESGFLHLWWTPFYGTGVIIAIIAYKFINSLGLKRVFKYLILALDLFIILTLLEYLGGVLLELLFGYSLWNYEGIPLHINKYISLPTSFGWVAFSFLYLFFIKKYTDKLVKYIPKFISIALIIIFIIDNIITIYQILHFRGFF